MQTNASNLTAFQTKNGLAPRQGPRASMQFIDMSVSNPFNLDFTMAQDLERLEWVQTLWIDNSLNASSFTATVINSGQKIVVPPFYQGYFPVLVYGDPKFQFSCSGTPIVPVGFLTMAMPCMMWNTINVLGTQGFDGSSTITAGGTAQLLFGGATPVNGFEITNPDMSNDLWISDSTTALANGAGSIRVAFYGGSYDTPPDYKPIGPVSIVGAVTGQKFTARRW